MYHIEGIEGEKEGIRIFFYDGSLACELRGGFVLLITATYWSLMDKSPERASDYLAGVMAGLNHCIQTQAIPVVAAFPTLSA